MLGSGMEGGMNETFQRLDELLERSPKADPVSGARSCAEPHERAR